MDAAELFKLAGKVALVTGATGGLGRAIAQAMAAQGACVIASDLDAVACQALADELSLAYGPGHLALAADLAQRGQADKLAEACGAVDILVCNAGLQGPAGPIGERSDADWERVFDVNLRSASQLAARLAPGMAERGAGSIILMSSIAGLRGNRAIGLYGLSKAALAQLARNLAVEWGPQGVRANAIAPGLIETPFAAGLIGDDAFMQRRLAMTPLRRVGQPHEVAAVAVLLASPGGAFITGQTLVVDGGTLISDGG
ncbi:SDR family NAD(P)-dependent oxidoreductase [Pelomonas sp. KK5]|uniref:SDR family NAD(P)-dependent oxidoreductase n=1 Tax=Pelomonas sp. KK5 TaxID=1855730 RepID=UPI00097BCE0A|nr:SDR family NAD(P)-dependent oxidoreductase [Pelomonas sp. KK5]